MPLPLPTVLCVVCCASNTSSQGMAPGAPVFGHDVNVNAPVVADVAAISTNWQLRTDACPMCENQQCIWNEHALPTMFVSAIITHQQTSCCRHGLTPFPFHVSRSTELPLSNEDRSTKKFPFAASSQPQTYDIMHPTEWSGLGVSCIVGQVLGCWNGVPLKCSGVSCGARGVQESVTHCVNGPQTDVMLQWDRWMKESAPQWME